MTSFEWRLAIAVAVISASAGLSAAFLPSWGVLAAVGLITALVFVFEPRRKKEPVSAPLPAASVRPEGALPRSREQLAAVIRAISEPVIAVDRQGSPLFFNRPFIESFGGPHFEKERTNIGELFRSPEVLDAFSRAARRENPDPVRVWLHTRASPSRRFMSVSVTPLQDSQGSVFGAVAVFHDLTELKKTEELRMDFLANVSHELKTPLTVIKGYTDTIHEDLAAGRTAHLAKFMDAVSRNVDRLMKLIQDVLDLSAIQAREASAGQSGPAKQKVDTARLTQRVISQLEPLRQKRGHRFELITEVDRVMGEPDRVEQVLVNLLENACKHVPEHGLIEVCWLRTAGGVELRVRDNGPGIAPQHQERLFERFYRADEGRSREEGGSGLGLAIVKHIVQNHGGSARVESRAGQGATFICEFPD